MKNIIDKYGVMQRCLEGDKLLNDLFLVALHFSRDMNFYIYRDNYIFLGIINREIILNMNLSTEDSRNIQLKDICLLETTGAIKVSQEECLESVLNDFFIKNEEDEVAIVDAYTNQLIRIDNRKDFYAGIISFQWKNNKDMVCYRQFSHRYEKNKYVLENGWNINSQFGEDGILDAIFNKIGVKSKYAVEFGAWDGIHLSNIRNLIISRGFDALFIEGDTERSKKLLENYKEYPNVCCVNTYVGFRGENTLDKILNDNHAPKDIEVISIDIDGYDYHVWDALKQYRPRIIIIEYNPSIPNDIIFINPYDENILTGSSASALVELGKNKGYSLIAVTQTNLFFIIDEEYNKMEIWDNDLNVLRCVERLSDGKYFQTYNKSIVFTGHNSYIWEGSSFIQDGNYIFTNV